MSNSNEEFLETGANFTDLPEGQKTAGETTFSDFSGEAFEAYLAGKSLRIRWDAEATRADQIKEIRSYLRDKGMSESDEIAEEIIVLHENS